MKHSLAVATAALAFSALMGAPAFAGPVLPAANCGLGPTNNCLTFGDFTVYSLALLNAQAGNKNFSPQSPYYVASNGSSIAAAIVIGSHPANAVDNQDQLPGKVDDAYDTPNHGANDSASSNFIMLPTDPGASFAGDNAAQAQTTIANHNAPGTGASGTVANGSMPLWDIQTSALLSYLNGGALQFYFNLNQTNSATSYLQTPEDMLASMDVIFTNTTTGAQVKFRLNGNSCTDGPAPPGTCNGAQGYAQVGGVNDILSSSTDVWAYVHGQICVNDSGAVLNLGGCTPLNKAAGGRDVNQNLGAEQAAFALYSQEVQDALTSGLYNIMSVDLRMAGVNNGFEQLFIEGGAFAAPEPSSIAIAGAGLALIGFGMAWRRRRAPK